MKACIKEIIVDKINKSEWWHVPPQDSRAYSKRGKFLASTYQQAEFYGRPSDTPESVFISNPIYGFSEREILMQLFPNGHNMQLLDQLENEKFWYQERIDLDAKMFERAKFLGYDAIVLMTPSGKKDLKKNRKPRSIELNLLCTQ
ncbi:MAG: hypothetical protein PHC29_00150 [Candidatus Omnitrophica bacterium]|nr:hypothetical protein [Candidatus Omnitrophota bacterium]